MPSIISIIFPCPSRNSSGVCGFFFGASSHFVSDPYELERQVVLALALAMTTAGPTRFHTNDDVTDAMIDAPN
jgi:hypothetical protein